MPNHTPEEGWEIEIKRDVGFAILSAWNLTKQINEFGSRNPSFDDAMKMAGDDIDKVVERVRKLLKEQLEEVGKKVAALSWSNEDNPYYHKFAKLLDGGKAMDERQKINNSCVNQVLSLLSDKS